MAAIEAPDPDVAAGIRPSVQLCSIELQVHSPCCPAARRRRPWRRHQRALEDMAPPQAWSRTRSSGALRFDRSKPRSQRYNVSELSLEAKALNDRLAKQEESPEAALHGYIVRQEATLETLRLCLREAYSRVTRLPRRDRLPVLRESSIGGTALNFVWDRQDIWAEMCYNDPATVFVLSYLAIGQGHLGLLTDWLEIKQPENYASTRHNGAEDHAWRGILFRSLIEAQTALDTDRSADSILTYYFSVLDRKRSASDRVPTAWKHGKWNPGSEKVGSPIVSMNVRPATIAVENAITSRGAPNTSPALFETFLRCRKAGRTGRAETDEHRNKYTISRLLLYRPRKPDAAPAIEFLRALTEDRSRLQAHQNLPKDDPAVPAFRRFLERTWQVTRETGWNDDEDWLVDIMHSVFPWAKVDGPQQRSRPLIIDR